MAVRQYIGARYVPKFFDWEGSPEWRSGVQYESLTIVTRNGNSYTSKIPVPSNVGAPENNPTYWVATGIYNEQVNSIRQLAENTADELDDFMSDGAIGTDNLAPNAVTTPKINNGSVTTDKIADGAVTSAKLNDDSVTTDKIADDAVTSAKLNDDSVTTDKISDGAVTGAKLYNGSVSTDKINNGAVTTDKLNDGCVTNAKLSDGSVTIDKIAPKYIINVGDSYQEGYDPAGNNLGWGSYLMSVFGYQGHNIQGVGGAGFGATAGSAYDFTTILTNNPPTGIDYDKVTDIIVGGGYNDFKRDTTSIADGITRFYNYCRTTYPNAKIWLAPIGWAWTNNADNITPALVGRTYREYSLSCRTKNINFITSCLGILVGCNGLSTDYKHPTENGNKVIACAINAALNGQSYLSVRSYYELPVTTANWSGYIRAFVSTVNGTAMLWVSPNQLEFNGSNLTLSDIALSFAHHPFMFSFSVLIAGIINYDSGNYANAPITFAVKSDGSCGLGMQVVNPTRNNYVIANKVTFFGLNNFQTTAGIDVTNG